LAGWAALSAAGLQSEGGNVVRTFFDEKGNPAYPDNLTADEQFGISPSLGYFPAWRCGPASYHAASSNQFEYKPLPGCHAEERFRLKITLLAPTVLVLLSSLAVSVHAQPRGSYRRTCTDVHMRGGALVAT
jgi:hypothetical protein